MFRRFVSSRARPRNALNLSLEAATYLVTAFVITGLGSYKAASAATYMETIKWAQVASIVGQAVLIWLVARQTRHRPVGLLVVLTGAYAVALLLHVTSESGLFLSYLKDIYLLPLPWGEGVIHPSVALDPWRVSIDVPNVITLIWVPYAFWRQYRRGERLSALFVGILALVVLGANLHDMYVVGPVYLAPYGFLLLLAVFWSCPRRETIPTLPRVEKPHAEQSTPEMSAAGNDPLTSAMRPAQWTLHPLLGVAMAMLLVSAAQMIGSEILERIVVLLVLLGMTQATIGALYIVGSGKWLRRLAILALSVLGVSQVVNILQEVATRPELSLLGILGLLHPHVQDWLWALGLLLLLCAFYLAGMEAGDSRKRLAMEHGQLVAEVAERRRAEGNLRASEERFRGLIENCTDIVAVLDAGGKFLYVGASVGQILGYDPDALAGKHVFEFCHPDDVGMLKHELGRIALKQRGATQTTEVRIRHSDGAWRIMEGIGRNRLSDPVLNGIVINARDITERKLMAERLESVKTAEQQRIRHDLHDTVGQDLTGLLCMAGSLAKKLQNRVDVGVEQAEAIVEGVRHTIADVRRAIQGIAPVEEDPRGLEVALGDLVDKTRVQHAIDARFECHAPVPIVDYGTATQLFRIAQEALTNALKHAHARRLVLSLLADSTGIVLAITDDGIGINGRGTLDTGMGLHTMRSRAAAIGATLRISGAPGGNGTRVECMLGRGRYEADMEGKGPNNFEI